MAEDLVQWNKVKGLERSRLDALLDLRRDAKKVEEDAMSEVAKINGKILTALVNADVKTVGIGETRVTLVPGGPTSKLDKKVLYTKLLEAGIPAKRVEKCFTAATVAGEEKQPYILVTEPKGEKGKE